MIETLVIIAIVIAAASYLLRGWLSSARGTGQSGCEGCSGCSCGLEESDDKTK
jgi:hypothetical protein